MQRFSYAKVPRNPGTAGRDFSVLEKDEHSAPKEVKVEALPVPTAAPDLAGDILKDPTLSRDQSSGSNLHVEKLSAFAKPQNEVNVFPQKLLHGCSAFNCLLTMILTRSVHMKRESHIESLPVSQSALMY